MNSATGKPGCGSGRPNVPDEGLLEVHRRWTDRRRVPGRDRRSWAADCHIELYRIGARGPPTLLAGWLTYGERTGARGRRSLPDARRWRATQGGSRGPRARAGEGHGDDHRGTLHVEHGARGGVLRGPVGRAFAGGGGRRGVRRRSRRRGGVCWGPVSPPRDLRGAGPAKRAVAATAAAIATRRSHEANRARGLAAHHLHTPNRAVKALPGWMSKPGTSGQRTADGYM